MPTDEQMKRILETAGKWENLSPEDQHKAIDSLIRGQNPNLETPTPDEHSKENMDMMALPSASTISPHLMSQAIRLVQIGEGRRSIRQMLLNQGVTDEIADTVSHELTSYRRRARRNDALQEMLGGFGCAVIGVIITAIAYYIATTNGESRFMVVGA